MPVDQSSFDYQTYAEAFMGLDWNQIQQQDESIIEAAKREVYREASNNLLKELGRKPGVNEYQALREAEKVMPDIREIMGISPERTKAEQMDLLTAKGYRDYLLDNDLASAMPDAEVTQVYDNYLIGLRNDKYSNPYIAERSKDELRAILSQSIAGHEGQTVKQFLDGLEESQQVASKEKVAEETAGATLESKTRTERHIDALKRSWANEGVQDAAGRLANPAGMETDLARQAGSFLPKDEALIQARGQTDENAKIKQDNLNAAADDLVSAINAREKRKLDPALQAVLAAPDVGQAFSELIKNPEAMSIVLAESGVDFIEETATQLGATVAGSFTPAGPVGGVAIGSAAMSGVVYDNMYNSFVSQEIEEELQSRNLPLTPENVKLIANDAETMEAIKEDAATTSGIMAGGSFAAGFVGGATSAAAIAKMAVRLGLKPVSEGGEIVFQTVSKKAAVGATAVAAAGASGIELAADIGSKAAIGEEISPGELVLSATMSAVEGSADVAIGAVAGGGDTTSDTPTSYRVGDIVEDADGNISIVTGGNGYAMTLKNKDGSRSVSGNDAAPLKVLDELPESPETGDAIPEPRPEAPQPEYTVEHIEPVENELAPDDDSLMVSYDMLEADINQIIAADAARPTIPDASLREMFDDALGGEFDFIMERVELEIKQEGGDVIFDDARRTFVREVEQRGLIVRDNGAWFPVITRYFDDNEVQARTWLAEIANYQQHLNLKSSDRMNQGIARPELLRGRKPNPMLGAPSLPAPAIPLGNDQARLPAPEAPTATRRETPAPPESPMPEAPGTPPAEQETEQETNLAQSVIYDVDDNPYPVDIEVIDASELPLAGGDLQPRNRSRGQMGQQVNRIARRLNYDRLRPDLPTMDHGAPVITKDGKMVAGNGRSMGIQEAYRTGKADQYRKRVEREAARLGIDITGIENPVFIRRIPEGSDAIKLSRQSNEEGAAAMSAGEQAKVDAENIRTLYDFNPRADGKLTVSSLGGVFTRMIAPLSDGKVNDLLENGSLTIEGEKRVRNALLYIAYGDSPTLQRIVENPDGISGNIINALVSSAGHIAELNDNIRAGITPDVSITDDLTHAIEIFVGIQNDQNNTVESFLAQQDMFTDLSPSVKELLKRLDALHDKPAQLRKFMMGYAEAAKDLAPENQSDLMGGAEIPTVESVIAKSDSKGQGTLFDRSEPTRSQSPEQDAEPEYNYEVVAPEHDPVIIDLGSEVNGLITQSAIDRLKSAGFLVDPIGTLATRKDADGKVIKDADGKPIKDVVDITGVSLRRGKAVYHVTSSLIKNARSKKDRVFTVRKGGKIVRKRVKGGKLLKSLGGNKRFTIPGDVTVIDGTDLGSFFDSVNIAAEEAGLEVDFSDRYSVLESRRLFPRDSKDKEQKFRILFYPDHLEINGVKYEHGTVGLKRSKITRKAGDTVAGAKEKASKEKGDAIRSAKIKQQRKPSMQEVRSAAHKIKVAEAERVNTFKVSMDGSKARLDSNNTRMQVEVPVTESSTPNDILQDAYMETIEPQIETVLYDGKPDGDFFWEPKDLEPFLNALPRHIRNIINIHYDADNVCVQQRSHGFFGPNWNNNGPEIHIDAHQRSFEAVLSTLSEEVAHFAFNLWATDNIWANQKTSTSKLEAFYKDAYAMFKSEIVSSLDAYIQNMEIDIENPKLFEQYVLVNELFSKQGTSFMELIDEKASAPAGLSRDRIQELKKLGREAKEAFVFNLAELGGGKDGVREFAEQILMAQSNGVSGKTVAINFTNSKDGGVLRITPTPFGQARRKMSVRGSEAEATAKRIGRINRIKNPALRKTLKWLYTNMPHRNLLSTRNVERITSNTATGLGHAGANRLLREDKIISQKVNIIARKHGINLDDETIAKAVTENGYQEYFKQLGIKNKKHLNIAKEADAFMEMADYRIVRGTQDIRLTLRKHVQLLEEYANKGEVDPVNIAMMKGKIRAAENRLKADWRHRRYRVYEDPEQDEILRRMYLELEGDKVDGKSLQEKFEEAEAAIARINASDMSDVEKYRAIHEHKEDRETYLRLEHLDQYFHYNRYPGRKWNGQIGNVKAMKDFIVKLRKDNRRYQGGGGSFTRLDSIASWRGLELDPLAGEHTSDYHMIQFLQPVNNPMEAAVHSIWQQKEVYRALNADLTLAEELLILGSDIASIRGQQETSAASVPVAGTGHEGSVLSFVHVDPVIAESIHETMEATADLNNSAINQVIGAIKQNKTVLNPGTNLVNYLGIPIMQTFHGHFFYLNKMGKAIRASREAWLQRTQEDYGDDYITTLVREMNENNVLGTGLAAGTIDVTQNNRIHETVIANTIKLFSSFATDKESRYIDADFQASKIMTFLRDNYAFSDDAPKILSYIIDREIGKARAKAKIKRKDFYSDDDYEAAILKETVRYAIDRTRRQGTDWGIGTKALRELATTSQMKTVIGDFIMHPLQMTKIATENFLLLGEDLRDYREASRLGNKAWKDAMARAISARGLGNLAIGGTIYAGWTAGTSLISAPWAGLAYTIGAIGEQLEWWEEEESPYATEDQREAMQQLMLLQNWGGAAHYEPAGLIDSEGRFLTVNFNRMNPFSTFMGLPEHAEADSAQDQFIRMLKNSMFTGEGDTLYLDIINAVKGVDWKGDKIQSSDVYFENLSKVTAGLVTPGYFVEAYEAGLAQSFVTGKYQEREKTALDILGVSNKWIDPSDILYQVGAEAGRNYIKSETLGLVKSVAGRGDVALTKRKIADVVAADVKSNRALTKKYMTAVGAARRLGMSESEIIGSLLSKEEGTKGNLLKKGQAGALLKGVDFYTAKSVRSIKKEIARLKSMEGSKGNPRSRIDSTIEDLEFALEQYELLSKN